MGLPRESELRDAVEEAEYLALSEGLTEPTAITERCVQILMRQFRDMDASAALSAYKRLRKRDKGNALSRRRTRPAGPRRRN